MNMRNLTIAVVLLTSIAAALYITTDVITTAFMVVVTGWIYIKLPSWPLMAIASVSFVAAFISLYTPPFPFNSWVMALPYYFLVAYIASEITDYIRTQKNTEG